QVLQQLNGSLLVTSVNIQAVSAAASVSVSVGNTGIGLSGGGASSHNVILSDNQAYAEDADLHGANVQIEALTHSGIIATVVAAAIGVGVGLSGTAASAAIGAALTQNYVGYEEDGARIPAMANAYIDGGTVVADNTLDISAITSQSITSVVFAGSVAVSAAPAGGSVGLSGSGASAINRIAADANAELRNIGLHYINAYSVNVNADDVSKIRSTAGAVAVAVAASSDFAVGLSIGVGLARNTITSEITANVDNVFVVSDASATIRSLRVTADSDESIQAVAFAASVAVGASGVASLAIAGAGAESTNVIQTQTLATVVDSAINLNGSSLIEVLANSNADIDALIVSIAVGVGAGSAGGIGASIGVALARNFIGYDPDTTVPADYDTSDNPDYIRAPHGNQAGSVVRVLTGVRGGDVYEYIGSEDIERPDLGDNDLAKQIKWLTMLDYGDDTKWRQLNLQEAPSHIEAHVMGSQAIARSVQITADAAQTINSGAGAGSAAISAGGVIGGSLSGAGVGAHNKIHNDVIAFFDPAGVTKQVNTGNYVQQFTIDASDRSTIETVAAAASLAGAFTGGASASIAIGASIARNEIANVVQSYAANAQFFSNTDITVQATEDSRIDALSGAVAVGVSVGLVGISLSGAGADAINKINNAVEAFVIDSQLVVNSLDVLASNSAEIDATVFAVAAAVSGGSIAGAGSIGVSIARNLIGRDKVNGPSGQNHTWAYVRDSGVSALSSMSIVAESTERVSAVSAAGSAAIAIGIGASVAGSGAETTNVIATQTHAWMEETSFYNPGDVTVIIAAIGDSQVTKAEAVGASVAGSLLGSIAIAASLVENLVDNDISARLSGSSNVDVTMGGSLVISARAPQATLEDVSAVSAAIAVGAFAASGGGVDIRNTITSTVEAVVVGDLRVETSSLDVLADSQSELHAEATVVSLAIGFSASVGVALVTNKVGGAVSAHVDNARLIANEINVHSSVAPNILETTSVGVSGGAISGQGNRSFGEITIVNSAYFDHVDAIVANELQILATTNNGVRTKADGGAFGAIAAAAMLSDIEIGSDSSKQETLAAIGDNSRIVANRVVVNATNSDSLRAVSTAGGAALAAAIGADSSITANQDVTARVGVGADITASDIVVTSLHNHDFDSQADSFSVAAGTGSGAGTRNKILGGAYVEIDQGASLHATTIGIDAKNIVSKQGFWGSANLLSGSFGLINTTIVTSKTHIGIAANDGETLDAVVNVRPGASILASDFGGAVPSRLRIEAFNDVTAYDTTKVEGGAGLAITTSISDIQTFTQAAVNFDGATVTSEDGDVYVTASTDSDVRTRAELMVFQTTGGGGADPRAQIHAINRITTDDAQVRGEDIYFWSGRRLYSPDSNAPASDVLVSLTESNIMTVSLGPAINVAIGQPTIDIDNLIQVRAGSQVEAYEDVNLIANRMNELEPIADASGMVVNVSLIPYGYRVSDDGVDVSIDANVEFEAGSEVTGGLYAQSAAIIEPVSKNGIAQIQLSDFGKPVSSTDRIKYQLSSDVDYVYGRLQLDQIQFSVSPAMLIRVAPGHTLGIPAGTLYRYIGPQDEILILPQSENYLDASRWTSTLTQEQRDRLSVYDSDITVNFANTFQDKFYVIRNRDLPDFRMTLQNVGTRLARQRREVLDWISNHSSDAEAVARYQEQLNLIDEQLIAMGLTETVTVTDSNGNSTQQLVVVPSFDTFIIEVPEIYSAPGSVLIEAVSTNALDAIALGELHGSSMASIKIENHSPFVMNVGDLTIADNRRVVSDEGELLTLAPGNVYHNFLPLTQNVGQVNAIEVTSSGYAASAYDLAPFEIPSVPQDLYVTGDIQNLNGSIAIRNPKGGVSVSGELRAQTVDVTANGDFNLNTEGWLHTNQDPRQYVQWSDAYNLLRSDGVSELSMFNFDLASAINRDDSRII
ncbi:MAG: hypothetical protein KDA92_13250, partial [Planctomycetales bacterium]|nr:hypothetical protein [Planctomycetales bacterium]